jgi:hypothetical protein
VSSASCVLCVAWRRHLWTVTAASVARLPLLHCLIPLCASVKSLTCLKCVACKRHATVKSLYLYAAGMQAACNCQVSIPLCRHMPASACFDLVFVCAAVAWCLAVFAGLWHGCRCSSRCSSPLCDSCCIGEEGMEFVVVAAALLAGLVSRHSVLPSASLSLSLSLCE